MSHGQPSSWHSCRSRRQFYPKSKCTPGCRKGEPTEVCRRPTTSQNETWGIVSKRRSEAAERSRSDRRTPLNQHGLTFIPDVGRACPRSRCIPEAHISQFYRLFVGCHTHRLETYIDARSDRTQACTSKLPRKTLMSTRHEVQGLLASAIPICNPAAVPMGFSLSVTFRILSLAPMASERAMAPLQRT